jgi:hypothetical protein
LFNRFEQAIGPKFIEEDWAHLRNPKNPVLDGVVYSVTKFIKLASDVNLVMRYIKSIWNTIRCWFRKPNDCDKATFQQYHHATMEAADTRGANLCDGQFWPSIIVQD